MAAWTAMTTPRSEPDGYHLAQLNIGRIVAPLDSEQLAGFVAGLEPINAQADEAPGFVWRLQTDEGDATALRPFDDDMILVNMSVWASVEALSEFVYRSGHRDVLRQRAEWFERAIEPYLVLWWVPAGHIPTMTEAKERLEQLRAKGPSADAFTFRHVYPAPGGQPG
jgi:uncharacterized protein DUF3291